MFINNKLLVLILAVSGYCYGEQPHTNTTSQITNISHTQGVSDEQNNQTKEEDFINFLESFDTQTSGKANNTQTPDSSQEPVSNKLSSNQSLSDILEKFKRGEYSYHVGQPIEVYNTNDSKLTTYRVHPIEGYGGCLGITTDAFETVVLECPGKKPEKPGCFDVFTPKSKPQNSTVVPVRQVTVVCVEFIDEDCVGLRWKDCSILFSCLPSAQVPYYEVERAMIVDIPFNGPPERF